MTNDVRSGESPVPSPARGQAGNYLAGAYASAQGDQESAIRYLKEVWAADPENMGIANQLLVLHLRTGETDKAVGIARRIEHSVQRELVTDMLLAIDDTKHERYDAAARRLKETFGPSGLGTLWLPLVTAWLDTGQGKVKKALRLEDVTKDKSAAGSFVYYHLALINDYAGFRKEAQEQYLKAMGNRGSVPYRVAEAVKNFFARNGDEKMQSGSHAMEAMPPELSHEIETGLDIPYDGENVDDVALVPESASKPVVGGVQEGMAEVFYTMGSILFGSGAPEDATLYLRLALVLRPDFPTAQLMLGNVLEDLGEYETAAKVYAGVDKASPLYDKGQLRTVFTLERMGQADNAEELVDAIIARSKDGFNAHIAKGDLMRTRSRYADAATAYSKALESTQPLKPEHWAVLYARGACHERAGQWAPAEKDLLKALELSPEQPDVLN